MSPQIISLFLSPFPPPDENRAALLCEALADPRLRGAVSELGVFAGLPNLEPSNSLPRAATGDLWLGRVKARREETHTEN